MSAADDDIAYWVIEEDSPLVVLPALWKRAPAGSSLAFEGIGTRDALSELLAPVGSDFDVFLDSAQEGTELYETRPSREEIAKLIASVGGRPVCEIFYHFKIIDREGRIWAWHHDACSGGFPYLNPKIDESLIAEIARELHCSFRLEDSGMWGWGIVLERTANKTPLPTPGKCPPSNHDQPPGAADL